jgi:lysophospholipase L1-like esterase
MKVLASIAALLFASSLYAQVTPATRPEDNVARPVDAVRVEAMPANPSLPTVWIIGDSTAKNREDLGWGDHFAHYVDTSRLNVVNRARAGRSSRTFIKEGAWDSALAQMKAGDFVLIQMGHNDGGAVEAEPKSRGTLKGTGEETKVLTWPDGANGSTEVVHTYGWYLRKYIADARAKGATPILLTLTVRNIWTAGRIERDMGYRAEIFAVGEETKTPVADMSEIAANEFEAMGQEKTAADFPIDHTHTSPAGAELNAKAVADSLRAAKLDVAKYLK